MAKYTAELRAVALHAQVKRAASGAPEWHDNEAMQHLVKLKRVISNNARAAANRAEEAVDAMRCERRHGPGAAYDAGYSMGPRRLTGKKRALLALGAPGFDALPIGLQQAVVALANRRALHKEEVEPGRTCVGDIRLCAIDLGFDPRDAAMVCALPANLGSRTIGCESRNHQRKWLISGETADVVGELKRQGYRVRVDS